MQRKMNKRSNIQQYHKAQLRLLGEKLNSLSSLMALFCLLVVTACSSGDVPGEETSNQKPAEAAISFNSGLTDGEDISRGDGLEEQTTSFKVWAYKNLSYTSGSYGGLQTVIDG